LSLEWKSEGVMDDDSGHDERDGLTSGWGGESRQRNESGSWCQSWGGAYLNERSVIFNEEMVVGHLAYIVMTLAARKINQHRADNGQQRSCSWERSDDYNFWLICDDLSSFWTL